MRKQIEGVKRLVEYGQLHKESPDYLRLEDVEGRDIVILSVEWFRGDFGDYAVMTVQDGDEQIKVRTGATLVCDALEDAEKQQAFPLAVTFKRSGRTWRFA